MRKAIAVILVLSIVSGAFAPSASASIGKAPVSSATNCGNGDAVLLTTDDWPYEDTTWRFETWVSTLRRNQTSAFFFTTAASHLVRQFPGYEPYVRSNGMWLGNHTLEHPHLPTLSDDEIRKELSVIPGVSGTKSNVFRPPYLDTNARVDAIAASLGMRKCMADVGSLDTTAEGDTVEEIRTNVLSKVRPGSVVLMHLHTKSIYALQSIIDGIRAKGLRLCKLQPPTDVEVPEELPC